ncbi:MAG TPA: glycolate oxidase subunit GlcE [Alphaproteobacteria bacterium]|nr:glycolate oxidase subunit GlcE [Alphaproteobacteria bacterium]
MSGPRRPHNLSDLREAIAEATASETSLEISGRASKRALGRPIQASQVLDLSALSGIRTYEPAELVLTAAAATPLAEIEAALAANNQMLAFEPPHWDRLLAAQDSGSLGGVLACNLAGPRRIKSGAARDHFLGVVAVSGRGEIFKAGGKVVKNVTGYDLCKLLAGSFGTLAAMEEVTVKVLPAPPKTRTVLLLGLDAASAVTALTEALNSAYEVSGAAYLPRAVAARSRVDRVRAAEASVTAIRVEGTAISVEARSQVLRRQFAAHAAVEELHTTNSVQLWSEIREVQPLLPDPGRAIWRASVPPTGGAAVAGAVGGEYLLDWGGGLVWAAMDAAGDGGAAIVRAAVRAAGGHALLVRAAPGVRAAVSVFEPQEGAVAALSARVKKAFDPLRVLNPGRMYAEL